MNVSTAIILLALVFYISLVMTITILESTESKGTVQAGTVLVPQSDFCRENELDFRKLLERGVIPANRRTYLWDIPAPMGVVSCGGLCCWKCSN